jgi:hypothetical protein
MNQKDDSMITSISRQTNISSALRRLIAMVTTIVLWLMVVGTLLPTIVPTCNAEIPMSYGRRYDVAILEKVLRMGISTREDVTAAFGTPDGKGIENFPTSRRPRTVWSYLSGEVIKSGEQRLHLLIYFDGDRYDGYLWFSNIHD